MYLLFFVMLPLRVIVPFDPYGFLNVIVYEVTSLLAGLYKSVDFNVTFVVVDCELGTVPTASSYDLAYDTVYDVGT